MQISFRKLCASVTLTALLAPMFPPPATAKAMVAAPSSELAAAVMVYNAIPDTTFLKEVALAGASPEMRAMISRVDWPEKQKLPKAQVVGDEIRIEGVKSALKVVNRAEGLFSLNGQTFTIRADIDPAITLKKIQSALGETKQSQLSDWIIPRAEAIGPLAVTLLSIWGVGAVAGLAGCYIFSNFPHDHGRTLPPGCALVAAGWPVLVPAAALIAGAIYVASSSHAATIPAKIECAKNNEEFEIETRGGQKLSAKKVDGALRLDPPNKKLSASAEKAAIVGVQAGCKAGVYPKLNESLAQLRAKATTGEEATEKGGDKSAL